MTRTPHAELHRAIAAMYVETARRAIANRDPVNALIHTYHAIRNELESVTSWKMGL